MTLGNRFDKALTEAIGDLLSKEGVSSTRDTLRAARDVLKQHEEAASGKKDEINASMAIEMRRLLPRVEVVFGDGITFKYKSRSVRLSPDFDSGTWVIHPGSEAPGDRRFFRSIEALNGSSLEQWQEVITKIAQRFVQHYRTLQGGKVQPPEVLVPSTTIPDDTVENVVSDDGAPNVQS